MNRLTSAPPSTLPPHVGATYPWVCRELPKSPFRGFNAFNPSIHRDSAGRWRCVVRNANYDARGGVYRVQNGTIRTQNLMLELTPELEVVKTYGMAEADGLPRFPTREHGFEDLRLFETESGGLMAVACTAQLRPESAPEMVVLELGVDYTILVCTPIRGGWSKLPQKNWSPFDGAPYPKFLYSVDRNLVVDPTVLMGMPGETLPETPPTPPPPVHDRNSVPTRARTGHTSVETRTLGRPANLPREEDWSSGQLRGGSQLVRVGDTWLGCAHWMDLERHKRLGTKEYHHRFFTTDGARGPWFCFGQAGIEFVAGMAVDANRLVLSYGVGDCEAWLGETELDAVMGSLK